MLQQLLEKAQQRFEICTQCEEFNKEKASCKKCGCYMKVKTKLPRAKCPINKW
jgi:hypothetical protein